MNVKLTYLQRSLPTAYGKDLYEVQAQSVSGFTSPFRSLFSMLFSRFTVLSGHF